MLLAVLLANNALLLINIPYKYWISASLYYITQIKTQYKRYKAKIKNLLHLSSSQDMSCQLHFGKIPLPNGLEEAVIANVRVLLCGGERVAASWQAVTTRGLCWGGLGFNKAVHRRVLQGKKSGDQQHPLIYTDTNII